MKLLNTSAIVAVALTATSAWASEHQASSEENMDTSNEAGMEASSDETMDTMSGEKNLDMAAMTGDLIRSRDITGGNVYTTNQADDEGWDPTVVYDGVDANWNDIGEIEDLVLSRDGQIIGIVAEIGGFLDIADKHVVVSVDDLSLVAVDDQTYAYVTRLNEEDLEGMQGVDEGFWN